MERRLRILIAEDDPAVRDALSALIESESDLTVVAAVGDAEAAIAAAAETTPDVALLDVRMPGGGGVHAARGIRGRSPGTRVIALSAHEDRGTVLEMLQAGVVGYLVKGSSIDSILESITQAADGQSSLSVEVTGGVINELVEHLGVRRRDEERFQRQRARIERVLEDDSRLAIALQPIRDLSNRNVAGYEALSRFSAPPKRGPDRWFTEAHAVGLGGELELHAAQRAVARLRELPRDTYLSVNVSPNVAESQGFAEVLDVPGAERLVLEITEHARIDDYDRFADALRAIRERGIRLAVDDAGAGFSSLRHILRLAPDFIKLDIELIAGIERDRSQQALAAGLISFAMKIGAVIIAEGIEREGEVEALRALGVRYGQGYFLGRPTTQPPADNGDVERRRSAA